MEAYVIDVNRLVNDIKGCIAQLKSTYFEKKDPIDDNEIILQKLCVKLETALRHGMKDKYSFLGTRKDYWNFFSECLSKDEGVRYVNSLSQLHTVQGKGRALIRYCLVQKTLADTIQRTMMHRRKTEWYIPEALLLNHSLNAALIGKLYDLNELEFHLSCTGCNLDISWPSFGRNVTDSYERRPRRNSSESIASTTDFNNERIDPLIALNAEISALKQMISRQLGNEKDNTDDAMEESSMSLTEETQPNISEITLDISRLHQLILKWKSSNDAKLYKAEHEIERLMEENKRLLQDSNIQLSQLAERHQNLSDLASKETALQIGDMQNKVRNAENTITEYKTQLNRLSEQLEKVSERYKDSQEIVKDMEKYSNDSEINTKKLESEIFLLKKNIESYKLEFKSLKDENNKLETEVQSSRKSESFLRKKLEENESKLNIITLEKDKLQGAFENVNGLVFGSFEDFESYYKSKLLDKEKGLEVKNTENKTLQHRLVKLTSENKNLERQLQEALDRNESVKKENLKSETQGISTSETEVKILLETIEKTNMNLSKWLNHNCGDVQEGSDTRSTEDKCQSLVNNLNQLDNQLKSDKESSVHIVEEKEKLNTRCKTLSLEIERRLQLKEELEREKSLSLLRTQEQQKGRKGLEDQVRTLAEDKANLQTTLNLTRKEKSDLDSELQFVNEKLQEESHLRIVLENEISEVTEQLNKEKCEQADHVKEIESLRMKVEESEKKSKDIKDELASYKEEFNTVRSNLDTKESELSTMEKLLADSVQKNEEMNKKKARYEEQLTNLQCTMDQQISSLKFQLSSEALKYDEKIKTLSEEKQETIALRGKIQENEETITELENKLKERNEAWQTEKKKLTSDMKLYKNEIKVLNEHIDADKQEIQSIENTLMLSKKKCEKEKNRNHEYRKIVKEIKDHKSENEKILEQEKIELEEDVKQLKSKLISLLSDKSELWKRSAQLEFDMKTRLSETWVEDKDVKRCPQCKTEFTLFVRKHHCRFCGNVFCHSCSDNFVKTIHSRKPYRACTSCYHKEKELKSDTSLNNSSLDQDDSSLSIDSRDSDGEDDFTSTPSKGVNDGNKQKDSSEVLSHKHVNDTKDSSGISDDSDENFQIIDEAEVSEDSLSCSLKNHTRSIKHNTILKPDDSSQDWSEVTLPSGKRYIMNVEALAHSQLAVEFTTSEQDILFGAAIKGTDGESELKTLIPLCQINSHERCSKKQLKVTSSGTLMLVFDNTHPKSSKQQLSFKIYLK